MTADDLRAQLAALGARRAKHRRELASLRPELAQVIRETHEAGIPIAEIARLTRMTRRAVYLVIAQATTTEQGRASRA